MILDHQKRRTRRQRGYQYPAGQHSMVEGVRPAMTSRRAMIDRQLAVIATARRQALPAENRLLKILLRSWSRTTRRVSAARARERAWRAVRSERLLGSAVTAWHSWARKNRASDSEWAARVEIVQKRRYRVYIYQYVADQCWQPRFSSLSQSKNAHMLVFYTQQQGHDIFPPKSDGRRLVRTVLYRCSAGTYFVPV